MAPCDLGWVVRFRGRRVNRPLYIENGALYDLQPMKRGASSEMVSPLRMRVLTTADEHTVAGALFGPRGEGRITEIDGFIVDAIPSRHMLGTRSNDVPGVIGRLGNALGERGVNISRFHLGRLERGG